MSRGPLVVAGYLTIDISARVEQIPSLDARVTAAQVWRSHGGMAANCACAAARLGSEVSFFGHAGDDALSDESLAALEACGVEAGGVVRSAGSGSICLILVAPDGGRAIVSPPLRFDWRRLDAALADGVAGFHVDGYRLDDALPRAAAARARGVTTSIDLDGVESLAWEDARSAAQAFSVLLLNRGVVAALDREPADAAGELAAAGADAVCVTLGADGVVVAAQDAPAAGIRGLVVETVDTTGAGDVFAGAFLHRLLGGAGPVAAAAFANAAAALSTTAAGARGLLPVELDVLRLLESNPKH